jgi:hypothetical protein
VGGCLALTLPLIQPHRYNSKCKSQLKSGGGRGADTVRGGLSVCGEGGGG